MTLICSRDHGFTLWGINNGSDQVKWIMNIMEPQDMGIMSDLPEIYPENLKTNKLFPASYPTAQSNFIFS